MTEGQARLAAAGAKAAVTEGQVRLAAAGAKAVLAGRPVGHRGQAHCRDGTGLDRRTWRPPQPRVLQSTADVMGYCPLNEEICSPTDASRGSVRAPVTWLRKGGVSERVFKGETLVDRTVRAQGLSTRVTLSRQASGGVVMIVHSFRDVVLQPGAKLSLTAAGGRA